MTRKRKARPTTTDAIQHADWAVASVNAWAHYLWKELQDQQEHLDMLHEELDELREQRKPRARRGRKR